MACPHFLPQKPLDTGSWVHAPRWPLGAAYSGICLARGPEPYQPSHERQQTLCNCGYARARCEQFPPTGGADAVRFSVSGEKDGILRLTWILEKEHAPADFGALGYDPAQRRLLTPAPGSVLQAQAEAFALSHIAHSSKSLL